MISKKTAQATLPSFTGKTRRFLFFYCNELFLPLQVFVSLKVFHLHFRNLVVIQVELCDGGGKIWGK